MVFELDEADDGKLRLTWLSEEADDLDKKFLWGQLTRLLDMKDYVTEGLAVADVTDHERGTIMEYYGAMVTALDYAIWGDRREHGFGENEDGCSDREDQTCSSDGGGAARALYYGEDKNWEEEDDDYDENWEEEDSENED